MTVAMAVEPNDFEDFEQRYSMYVLMMVADYPGCIKTDISPLGDTKRSAKFARADYLIEKGYIEYMEVNGRPTKRMQLTEKGEMVAEQIRVLGEIIKKSKTQQVRSFLRFHISR